MRGRKGKVDMVNKKDLRAGVLKMREVAELLSGWADDMERSLEKKSGRKTVAADAAVTEAAEAAEAAPVDVVSEPAQEAAGDAVAPPEPAAQPSFEDVRTLLVAKSAAGCRTQVLALIRSYGAEKLSEVDPAHYADLVVAAAALGEPLSTAGGGNLERGEVSRNERSVQRTVATIEDAVGDGDAG